MDRDIANATIEWDVENWSRALDFWSDSIEKFDTSTTRVLCLGERNGGLSLWFALRGFKVICSDYGGPTELARELHKRHGVSESIEYRDHSVFALPYPEGSFDLVACKSVIGGLKLDRKDKNTRTLQNQRLAIDEVRRVLKTNGYFLGAENMRGSLLHRAARKMLKGNRIGWRHFKTSELKWMFEGFSGSDFRFFGFIGTYYPWRRFNRITGALDVLLSEIFPNGLLYIGFIKARK